MEPCNNLDNPTPVSPTVGKPGCPIFASLLKLVSTNPEPGSDPRPLLKASIQVAELYRARLLAFCEEGPTGAMNMETEDIAEGLRVPYADLRIWMLTQIIAQTQFIDGCQGLIRQYEHFLEVSRQQNSLVSVAAGPLPSNPALRIKKRSN